MSRALPLCLAFAACNLTPPPEPARIAPPTEAPRAPAAQNIPPAQPVPTAAPPPEPAAPRMRDVRVNARVMDPTSPDPLGGRFTLAQATAGLPPGNTLVADIETSMGTFTCTLLPDRAPGTVANFVGLARGLRDFWDPVAGAWAKRPFYDGSVFHRVIPGFMIQGGDILRSGMGGTGYEHADENVRGHTAGGQLCMANRGPNTNGGQFFITEGDTSNLDGSYSIFGNCTPTDLVRRIAGVPRNERDMPYEPVEIRHVRVHR